MKKFQNYLAILTLLVLGAGCVRNDNSAKPGQDGDRVDIPVSFTGSSLWMTKALSDTHNVDRVLLLPFVMVDPSAGDIPINFEIEPRFIKQIEVGSFPVSASLSLQNGATYRVVALGYNHADMDKNSDPIYSGSIIAGETFGIVGYNLSATFIGTRDVSLVPWVVPEIFKCFCTNSLGEEVFVAGDNVNLAGDLNRIFGGLSVEITNIPESIVSVVLGTSAKTRTVLLNDLAPYSVVLATEGNSTPINSQTPVSGSVLFEMPLLTTGPANDANPTGRMKLIVSFADALGNSTRHELKFDDGPDVTDNAFAIEPNRPVYVRGDYNTLEQGFSITFGDGINLEDDIWDGL